MKYIHLLMVGMIAILFTACSAEELLESQQTPQSIKIVVSENPVTRSVVGPYTGFVSGDAIGVYAVDDSGVTQASNVRFTFDGSSWNGDSDVPFNPEWSYYAYFPYVSSPYTPSLSASGIDSKFALFIADASNKFHKTDQSTLANYKASDLKICEGVPVGLSTMKFTLEHKKALAYLYFPGDASDADFEGNIPYISDTKGYYCMKTNNGATTIGGYSIPQTASGKYINCVFTSVPVDYPGKYLTFKAIEDGFFSINNPQGTYYYSKNKGSWTQGTSVSVTAGDKVRWKNNASPSSSYGVGTFTATGQFNAIGNPLSLIYGDSFKGVTDISGKSYALRSLFQNNTNLINAENLSLPATTLAQYCYRYMFSGCTGLTTAPELSATTLASYCYGGMFSECTGLTTAPALPATTLATYCYQNMFSRCTGLTTAPELPATTLADYCYNSMFSRCTGLVQAPALPATTLDYGCYDHMFYGCTNLNYIKMMATNISASNCLFYWVVDVKSTGTFVKNSAATWNRTGSDGIPSGWTVQTASE